MRRYTTLPIMAVLHLVGRHNLPSQTAWILVGKTDVYLKKTQTRGIVYTLRSVASGEEHEIPLAELHAMLDQGYLSLSIPAQAVNSMEIRGQA